MASKIGMASNALLLLGDRPISSFTDNTAGAQAMANLYESTYTDLVTNTPWTFARKQRTLSQNTTAPTFKNYKYSYNLPNDYLAGIGLLSNMQYNIYIDGKLYTNDSNAQLEYICRPDEGNIPPYFQRLVEETLAARAAMAVTDNASLATLREQRAELALSRARSIDAQSDTNEAIRSSPFTECRG